ncbi:MAG TPA: PEP-CTERM sorting domain-containing protein, partial [Pirellula sp.]|nr:PEP-CTERM sorting domain-containing protein [Pirellula sp.]
FAGLGPFAFSLSNQGGNSAVIGPGVNPPSYPTVLNGGAFIVAVPEPSSIALLGLVGVGVVAARRFRKKSKV